jgi:hypothetical protein
LSKARLKFLVAILTKFAITPVKIAQKERRAQADECRIAERVTKYVLIAISLSLLPTLAVAQQVSMRELLMKTFAIVAGLKDGSDLVPILQKQELVFHCIVPAAGGAVSCVVISR